MSFHVRSKAGTYLDGMSGYLWGGRANAYRFDTEAGAGMAARAFDGEVVPTDEYIAAPPPPRYLVQSSRTGLFVGSMWPFSVWGDRKHAFPFDTIEEARDVVRQLGHGFVVPASRVKTAVPDYLDWMPRIGTADGSYLDGMGLR